MNLYSPSHYQESRPEFILEFIRKHSFATLVTCQNDRPLVSQVPLLLDGTSKLIGHIARANPHWRELAAKKPVTAIFNGPHSYISPSWYQPAASNVPTWNYLTVHCFGHARIIEDAGAAYSVLVKTTNYFEERYQTGWSLPAEPNPELANLLKGIVAFEIEIEETQAKFKLSQREEPSNRENVIGELSKLGFEHNEVAEYMRKFTPPV